MFRIDSIVFPLRRRGNAASRDKDVIRLPAASSCSPATSCDVALEAQMTPNDVDRRVLGASGTQLILHARCLRSKVEWANPGIDVKALCAANLV